MIGWFGTHSMEEVKETKAQVMKSDIKRQDREQYDYYFNKILDLMTGSHKMGMSVINLEKIQGWCHYYGIDDTIVYWDNDIRDSLLEEGIASYNNSSDGLVITTSEDRVNNMKKDGNKK